MPGKITSGKGQESNRAASNGTLLSQITADPTLYQKRDGAFSGATVSTIVAEGIQASKFDPIPLLPAPDGSKRFIIAGDGHSRLEAIKRLAPAGQLPAEWKRKRGQLIDWEIPSRIVDAADARRLSWTANLSRTDFSPAEEAGVYSDMLKSGMSIEEIAKISHKSEQHVSRMLPINSLCRDIRIMIGQSPAAGGIDVLTAQVLATGFERYAIGPAQQRDLWHGVLKGAMLNFQSSKRFIEQIGPSMADRKSDGMLFEMPANAMAVVEDAKARGQAARTAKTGLSLLVSARANGGLEGLPELARWLDANGQAAIDQLNERITGDADVLAQIVTGKKSGKRFKIKYQAPELTDAEALALTAA
jgi:hypothetical protein